MQKTSLNLEAKDKNLKWHLSHTAPASLYSGHRCIVSRSRSNASHQTIWARASNWTSESVDHLPAGLCQAFPSHHLICSSDLPHFMDFFFFLFSLIIFVFQKKAANRASFDGADTLILLTGSQTQLTASSRPPPHFCGSAEINQTLSRLLFVCFLLSDWTDDRNTWAFSLLWCFFCCWFGPNSQHPETGVL